MPNKIFVNYRRDDAAGDARGVRDGLAAKFGQSNVFMDVDDLRAGQRFDVELAKALDACDVFLAVIGPHWMDHYGSDTPIVNTITCAQRSLRPCNGESTSFPCAWGAKEICPFCRGLRSCRRTSGRLYFTRSKTLHTNASVATLLS